MSQAGLAGRLTKILGRAGVCREEIEKAARIIRGGGLVAFPTETVYGLGANALDEDAVARIYEAKGRPSDNPIIVHVCGIEMAETAAELNQQARKLMEKFWPGPLSLVLKSLPVVPEKTRGGLETVAVRMPDNETALALIEAAGVPIAAPSANISGRPSPTDAQSVRDDLGESVAMVLDGGPAQVGLESTVLDVTGERPVLLRPGGISKEAIEAELGVEVLLPQSEAEKKRSPGTRYRHYAPNLPLILEKKTAEFWPEIASLGKTWAWLGVKNPPLAPEGKITFADTEEYARGLFRALRVLENSGVEIIIAEVPEGGGIAAALKDRLNRASGASD